MFLEPEKGSCALAVLKLCLQVMHLLAQSPSGFTCAPVPATPSFSSAVLVIFSKYYFAGFFPSLFC